MKRVFVFFVILFISSLSYAQSDTTFYRPDSTIIKTKIFLKSFTSRLLIECNKLTIKDRASMILQIETIDLNHFFQYKGYYDDMISKSKTLIYKTTNNRIVDIDRVPIRMYVNVEFDNKEKIDIYFTPKGDFIINNVLYERNDELFKEFIRFFSKDYYPYFLLEK